MLGCDTLQNAVRRAIAQQVQTEFPDIGEEGGTGHLFGFSLFQLRSCTSCVCVLCGSGVFRHRDYEHVHGKWASECGVRHRCP